MTDDLFLNILKDKEIDVVDDIPTTGFIDTGSYALNALLSASIFGGTPNNRATMWAGAPSAGKTYLMLSNIKTYLNANPESRCLFFDTEFALEEEMLVKRGIDSNRFKIVDAEHLQDFRTKAVKFLDGYEVAKKKPPVLIALDSLSNLATAKEIEDATNAKDVRDMTKAQVIRSIFRIITRKLGKNQIPLLMTNHIYSTMDQYSPVAISGGQGALYAASTVVTLRKSKLKEGTDVIGNIIKATSYKSRYSKENQTVELRLDYDTGLDRYYGLLPLAEKYNIIKKVSTRYELPDGTKVWGKDINENPEKVFVPEILEKINKVAKIEFGLGNVDVAAEGFTINEEVAKQLEAEANQ
jgi:RecA/RadA recombinase